MNRFATFFIMRFVFFVLVVTINFATTLYAFDLDPKIETVSTGPFHNISEITRVRFRCVIFLNEVSLDIYIERIEYGEENCCPKVTKSFQLDPRKIEGDYKLYDVTNIKWISYDSFSFIGNSTNYIVKNLNGKYNVIRE